MLFFLTQLSTRRQFEHSISNSILSTILKGTFPSLTLSPCLHLPTDAFALWNLLSIPPYLWSRMEKTTTTQGKQPYPIYPCTWRDISEWERQLHFLLRFFLFLGGGVGFGWVSLVPGGVWVVCFYLVGPFSFVWVFLNIYTHFHCSLKYFLHKSHRFTYAEDWIADIHLVNDGIYILSSQYWI